MKVHGLVKIPSEAARAGGVLQDFVWNRIVSGERVLFENGEVVVKGMDSSVQPTFEDLVTVVANGGYFEGVKLAIRFDNLAAAQQDVPASVRGATEIVDGQEQPRNWVQWFQSGNMDAITDGTSYVIKAVYLGKLLNSNELTAIHTQPGVTVIEFADAVELFQSEDWEAV